MQLISPGVGNAKKSCGSSRGTRKPSAHDSFSPEALPRQTPSQDCRGPLTVDSQPAALESGLRDTLLEPARQTCSRTAVQGVDFLGRPDVVRQFDPGRAVTAERGPQAEDHSACLEKRDLVVRLLGAAPAEGLVEGSGAGEIRHAKGHHADPLFHGPSMASA